MTEDEFRRTSDIVASRTEQKLDDFIERYERDQVISKEQREQIIQRLAPLEDIVSKLKTPLYAFGVICLAVLGGIGHSVWKWCGTHWN
jgi:hypothetical protein